MADGLLPRPDTRKAALTALAEEGAHFVLCGADKRPKAKAWHKAPASLDAALRHKGLVGVVPASLGCVVVDVDEGGDEARQAVISQLGRPVAEVPTRRDGGWHLWFKCRDAKEIGNRAWQGGDIRGAKGQAILWAPELVAEGLACAEPVADLMAVDLDQLPSKRDGGAVGERNMIQADLGGGGKGGKSGPDLVRAATHGHRNSTLNEEVFKDAQHGCLIDARIAEYREAATAGGQSSAAVDATIASAQKAGAEARANSGDVLAFPSDLSPHGLHRLWLATNGEDWRYLIAGTSNTGTWAHWTGARYKQVSEVYAFRDVSKLVAQVADSASRGDGADKRRGAVRSMKNSAFTVDVSKFNRGDRVDQFEKYDAEHLLLNTPGGVVNLETGHVAAHDRSQRFLKIAGATPDGGACDLWRQCLNDWCADDDMSAYLQRVVGYSLRGDNQSHAVVFVYGDGSNGKSTFLKVWQALLGDYARPCPHRLFMRDKVEDHLTALAGLAGTRLAAIPEVPVGSRWDEEALKQASGGDKLTARFMRQDYFDFTPQFLPVIVGNNSPTTRDVGESMRRRLHIVPFTESFDKSQAIPKLAERLIAEELPGIMKWAIDGHRAYMLEGLSMPEKVAAETEQYFENNDRIGRYLTERTVSDPIQETSASRMYDDFSQWVLSQGERPESLTRFGSELAKRGVVKLKGRKGVSYLNITLRDGGF